MSEETTTSQIPAEVMQILANADGVLADLTFEALMAGDTATFDKIGEVGVALWELEHHFVETGRASEVLKRNDKEEDA